MAVLNINCRKFPRLIYGRSRKVAMAFLVFSTLGWTVFVVFFGLTTLEKTVKSANCVIQKSRVDGAFTPHWCFLVTGPILYTCAIAALLSNKDGYIQMIINFLVAILFICGGGIIYTDWIIYDGGLKYLFEFGACFTTLAAIVLYMMTVPLFKPLPKHAVQKQTNSSQDEYQADTNTTELKPSNTLVSKNYAYNSRAALKLEQETEEVETEHESPNEYVVPDEVITASNDAEETEYVVNELALYESYEDDDHAEEVYEDMEAVQNTDDYEELRAH